MTRRPSAPFLLITLMLACAAASADAPGRDSGWMGVLIEGTVTIDDEDGRSGVRLGRIFENSPAARAGLRARDVVLDVDGRPVTNGRELASRIREHGERAWIPLSVWRNGEQRDLRIRLGSRPGDTSSRHLRRGRVGLAVIDLPPTLREHFGTDRERGVMISEIAAGSTAEAAGLELGDVVVSIDEADVRGPGSLQRLIQGAGVGNTIELTVMRDGVEMVLEAVVEHDAPETAETR